MGARWKPAWTFASDRDGDFDIYSADPDGSNVRILTDDAVDQRDPFDLWTWRESATTRAPKTLRLGVGRTSASRKSSRVPRHRAPTPGSTPRLDRHWAYHSPTSCLARTACLTCGQKRGASLPKLTFGRKSDADPAVRPANKGVVTALTRAAGDIDQGLRGAQAWVDANGSGTGADEGPAGLITEAPTLCLVDADELSSASAATCDAGSGTGSTSVYADADEISLARDTGLGFCLWATFHSRFAQPWEARFDMTFNAPGCTGRDARQAIHSSW